MGPPGSLWEGQEPRQPDFLLQELNREANTLGSKSDVARTSQASVELKVLFEFDYIIVNEDFDTAVAEMCSILRASRLRGHVQRQRHSAMIRSLIGTNWRLADCWRPRSG